MKTPYELGNGNQTTTHDACIAFYRALAERFPKVLSFGPVGETDCGVPLHAGVVSSDGVFDRTAIQAAGRTVFFLNNGIHPGEPEGIDARHPVWKRVGTVDHLDRIFRAGGFASSGGGTVAVLSPGRHREQAQTQRQSDDRPERQASERRTRARSGLDAGHAGES